MIFAVGIVTGQYVYISNKLNMDRLTTLNICIGRIQKIVWAVFISMEIINSQQILFCNKPLDADG